MILFRSVWKESSRVLRRPLVRINSLMLGIKKASASLERCETWFKLPKAVRRIVSIPDRWLPHYPLLIMKWTVLRTTDQFALLLKESRGARRSHHCRTRCFFKCHTIKIMVNSKLQSESVWSGTNGKNWQVTSLINFHISWNNGAETAWSEIKYGNKSYVHVIKIVIVWLMNIHTMLKGLTSGCGLKEVL